MAKIFWECAGPLLKLRYDCSYEEFLTVAYAVWLISSPIPEVLLVEYSSISYCRPTVRADGYEVVAFGRIAFLSKVSFKIDGWLENVTTVTLK